jgi:hypothetical protein
MGKINNLSAFERGGRCQVHQFECVKNCKKPTSGFFSLSTSCRVHARQIEAVLRAKRVQINIREVFLRFHTLGLHYITY